ncbi:hypothetical protein FNF29_08164 [Cafeteria roenbergensis]|uniref:Uncharacterized protein n=1 Tax=Cafeteria roenbergensis TaxID=33653 RepID=A0A5A8C111_CAFRO|nr:hypothetical protein FNF29_08164 [Cafeteria roenbergensis]|eukprot:KAA0146249.1 hypothetical protein FNF29_08164 [Cafeteria roenbergensis]
MDSTAVMDRDDMGRALWDAAAAGNTGEVTRLLEAGVPVNWAGGGGQTPLMKAAERCRIESMRVLLDRGADLEARSNGGNTALLWAVWAGKVEAMALLVDRGADLDAKSNSGWTALIWAVFSGKVDAVALLLDRGADPEIRDKVGKSALDRCRSDTCKRALRDAERRQRWRRRRLLVTWRR